MLTAGLGLGLLLGACAEEKPAPMPGPFGQYIPSAPRKPVRPPSVARGKPEVPPAEATELPQQPGALLTEAPPEQTALAVPAAPTGPASADLLGLDPQRTRELLGPAAQTRNQSPATVWHYKSGRCELDLSFYMEMKSGQMRSLHYDFKGEAESPEQRQACIRSIIEENRKPERS